MKTFCCYTVLGVNYTLTAFLCESNMNSSA